MIMTVCYVRPYKSGAYCSCYSWQPAGSYDASICVHENVFCYDFVPKVDDQINVIWSRKKKKRYGFRINH